MMIAKHYDYEIHSRFGRAPPYVNIINKNGRFVKTLEYNEGRKFLNDAKKCFEEMEICSKRLLEDIEKLYNSIMAVDYKEKDENPDKFLSDLHKITYMVEDVKEEINKLVSSNYDFAKESVLDLKREIRYAYPEISKLFNIDIIGFSENHVKDPCVLRELVQTHRNLIGNKHEEGLIVNLQSWKVFISDGIKILDREYNVFRIKKHIRTAQDRRRYLDKKRKVY